MEAQILEVKIGKPVAGVPLWKVIPLSNGRFAMNTAIGLRFYKTEEAAAQVRDYAVNQLLPALAAEGVR